ncbi:MAG TPA: transketolase [Candidatus Krumholzibacteria bacterium]|nr:transketolase [Candidatus Krumholzibacteria bacterium]
MAIDQHSKGVQTPGAVRDLESAFQLQSENFAHWEKIKDCVDQYIDLMLNYRQSGHPGGSRSKVHAMISMLLSGAMRWDIRHPEKPFGDRFALVAGHTAPLVYATLPVLAEPFRLMYERTKDKRYFIPEDRMVWWEDLIGFRHNKGLPGHAEMEGKTLFFKANTGPSGHGSPAAAGQAVALKRAGADGVRVFAFEGEGGLTPGATHETLNSAYGLGLTNFHYVIDWNDFGIDDNAFSSFVYGSPRDWFGSHGWRVVEAKNGSDWADVTRAMLEMAYGANPDQRPSMMFMRTRKGREYLKYDNKSHGSPHAMNSELFWNTKQPFMEKYGVRFQGFGEAAPKDAAALKEQARANLKIVADVIRGDNALVEYVTERLLEIGDSVPESIPSFRFDVAKNPAHDPALTEARNYPAEMWAKPGEKQPNRAALARWGAWVNTWCRENYGRPLFLAMSADLADSTNISGFAKDFGDKKGWGWFNRDSNPEGALLPQGITEFSNAGISCGLASVNFSKTPLEEFNGFYGTCSTYGSFIYLKYGPMRLFSQMAQDSQLKVGKVLWVAGHSGPETAEDSRTHFGVFAPGVTQLFPEGHVIDVHPWEFNEVPVVIAAALKTNAAIIALHLTRPAVEIPDREKLGMASHFDAARGAYVIRPYQKGAPKMGVVVVQGTSTTNNLLKVLPRLDEEGLNVKIVAAISPQLFKLQDAAYRDAVLPAHERMDAMAITNRARRLMMDWADVGVTGEYWMGSDFDNRWRTGGSVDEVLEEAHLTPQWILEGIRRFAKERDQRLKKTRDLLGKLDA